ncbi:MAG: protein kinase, partial [Thermomicrobia bacterium]|nr:protein kinase [Thermomicrobia bacterium]
MSEASEPPGTPVSDSGATIINATPDRSASRAILRGKYQTSTVLGEGAFGRVYLATDTQLRSKVAIKELLAERNGTDPARYEQYLDRFQREARAARVSQHPNIVTVYDLDRDESGNYYLVMEYVDGTDLRELLKKEGALSVERAVALTIEIAEALEAVHEQEIVHRDLKPANIMITRRGTAKLADFGIAQVGHESMRTRIAVGHPGTPMYMSPEQSSGQQYLNGASDLYSLGLILYEMLVGTPYVQIRQPLAVARPETPPALVRIVNKLIEADQDARYQHAADVARDLKQLTAAPTVPAPDDATHAAPTLLPTAVTTPQPTPSRGIPRGRRATVAVGGVVVAAMVLALVLFATQRNTPGTPTSSSNPPTVAPSAPVTTAAANVFTVADAQNLISFSYPQEWTASNESGDASTLYTFTSVRPVGQLHLFVDSVEAGLTLDTYADKSLASLLSSGNKPGSKGKQTVKVAGQDARLIDAIGTPPSGDLIYYYQYITFHDNHAWSLAFFTPLSETDTFQKQSDIVINSFAFCAKTGCTQTNTAPQPPPQPSVSPAGTAATTPASSGTSGTSASGTVANATPAPPASGALTVADANYLVSFSYPRAWQRQSVGSSADTLYSFNSTSPPGRFSLVRDDVLPGTTLDAYVDSAISQLRSDPKSKAGPKGRQSTTVGGQDARLIDVLVPMTNDSRSTYTYQYILLRDNRVWLLTFGTPDD